MAANLPDGVLPGQETQLWAFQSHMHKEMFPHFLKFVEFLGMPDHPQPPMEVARSKDIHSLWELYYGQNPFLSNIVDEDLTAVGTWVSRVFPRAEFKDGMSLTRKRMVFDSQVMDTVPEGGVNPVMGAYETVDSFTMTPLGNSFWMNQNFIYHPDGPQMFVHHCRQLERCAVDSMDDNILDAIKEHGIRRWLLDHARKPMAQSEFHRVLQDRVLYFGIFQKVLGGHVKTQAEAIRRAEISGVRGLDLEILPTSKARIYVKFADPREFIYKEGGPAAVTVKEIRDDKFEVRTKEFPQIVSRTSRPYKYPGLTGVGDMFVEYRTIGTFAYGADLSNGRSEWKDYRSDHRTLRIGHAERVHDDLPLMAQLDASQIYDPQNGQLTEWGTQILPKIVMREARERKDEDIIDTLTRKFEPRLGHAPGANRRRGANAEAKVTLRDAYLAAGMLDDALAHIGGAQFQHVQDKFFRACYKGSAPDDARGLANAQTRHVAEKTSQALDFAIDGHVLRALVNFNLRVPITFIASRRKIIFEAGQYFALKSGAETGTLYTSKTIINLTRLTKTRRVGVDLNFDLGTDIVNNKNIIYIPDVLILGYISGYTTECYGVNDEALSDQMQNDTKSVHIFAVHPSWRPKHSYLDVTGRMNRDMVNTGTHQDELQFETADIYNHRWKFGAPMDLFVREAVMNQQPDDNTLCMQEEQRMMFPADQVDPHACHIRGQGHMGSEITIRTFKALRGELTHMCEERP